MAAIDRNDLPVPDDVPADPAEYDAWVRAKVEASRADTQPSIPHEQVMAEMRALIEKARKSPA